MPAAAGKETRALGDGGSTDRSPPLCVAVGFERVPFRSVTWAEDAVGAAGPARNPRCAPDAQTKHADKRGGPRNDSGKGTKAHTLWFTGKRRGPFPVRFFLRGDEPLSKRRAGMRPLVHTRQAASGSTRQACRYSKKKEKTKTAEGIALAWLTGRCRCSALQYLSRVNTNKSRSPAAGAAIQTLGMLQPTDHARGGGQVPVHRKGQSSTPAATDVIPSFRN